MNGLTIQPNGQTLVVTSGPANFYSDTGLSSAVTYPVTVTTDTPWYCSPAVQAASPDVSLVIKQPDGSTIYSGSIRVGQTSDTFVRPQPAPYQVAEDTARPDVFLPTGAKAETFSRRGSAAGNVGGLGSGTMRMTGIYLSSGVTVSSISYLSGSTALSGGTNQWFALYTSGLTLLRQTVDDTSTAWAANTVKTLTLTTPIVTTYSGLHYVALLVAASTPPSLAAITGWSVSNILGPAINGNSTSGLTGTAPATASALSAQSQYPWAYVS